MPTSSSKHLWRTALTLSLVASWLGCSDPPGTQNDAGDPFDWQLAVTDLDEAVLATCGQGSEYYAVGGWRDSGLILEWSGTEWRAALPEGSGILWWCWVDDVGTVWAAGERATLLKRVGTEWVQQDVFTAIADVVTLYGIWGTSASDIYVVGGSLTDVNFPSAIAHFDGQRWLPVDTRELATAPLFKVWGTSSTDVWAVGAQGVVLHYDGAQWTAVPSQTEARLIAVWGTGPDDVYAVGGAGTGVVLRYDGTAWSEFAQTPEELSGVWTAPGRPLYVGGNRGLLVRYNPGADGRPDPARTTISLPVDNLDVHALYGSDDTILAASADLFSGGVNGWRGSILVHGQSLSGPVVFPMTPDAGVADAGPVDASIYDAPIYDASLYDSSIYDARRADASGPGPGEPCGQVPNVCASGLDCWFLVESGRSICTELCVDANECGAYGGSACCARPGFQTLDTVCIPAKFNECNM